MLAIKFDANPDSQFNIQLSNKPEEPSLTTEDLRPRQGKFLDWQRDLEAALTENDPEKLRQRVDAAEAAIFLRSQGSVGLAEKEDMAEAIRKLRAIQRDKLGYPDWKKS